MIKITNYNDIIFKIQIKQGEIGMSLCAALS